MSKEKPNSKLTHITTTQAKKEISEMNLINGFLFDSTMENTDDGKIIIRNILKAVFFRDFDIEILESQKALQAIDTSYHGIRFDVKLTESTNGNSPLATVYDTEMEDRPADKAYLPQRLRYYSALNDTKVLEAGEDYNKLPDFVSIVILSYDPFDAGDMYYEAKSVLITHPDIPYKNGIRNIFLYCNGNPNFDDPNGKIYLPPEHSKMLKEMLKYIVSGEKPVHTNSSIEEMDKIVTKVKSRKEVTTKYMRQWEREISIKRETRREDALDTIRFSQENGISEENIRNHLKKSYKYDDKKIDELFDEVKSEVPIS